MTTTDDYDDDDDDDCYPTDPPPGWDASAQGYRPGRATTTHSCNYIRGVPSNLRSSRVMKPSGLSSFYQRYTEAYGIPVLGKCWHSSGTPRLSEYRYWVSAGIIISGIWEAYGIPVRGKCWHISNTYEVYGILVLGKCRHHYFRYIRNLRNTCTG